MIPLTDLAVFAVLLGHRLNDAGVRQAVSRTNVFVESLVLLAPATLPALYWCARISFVVDRDDISTFDEVFFQTFGGLAPSADVQLAETKRSRSKIPLSRTQMNPGLKSSVMMRELSGASLLGAEASGSERGAEQRSGIAGFRLASLGEGRSHTNFAELTAVEIAEMAPLMDAMVKSAAMRRARRYLAGFHGGNGVDLRKSVRYAHRTGGDVAVLIERRRSDKPRPLVALLDSSRSMERYSRAYLHFLNSLTRVAPVETFVFSTVLTRVTKEIRNSNVNLALEATGRKAASWHGGTLIGSSLEAFVDGYGRRGAARGAIMLIFSDGWEVGDTSKLAEQMRRLSLLAKRIIWVNPLSSDSRYEPKAAGMASALPFCDRMVSGHSLTALLDVVNAMYI